MKYMKRYLSSSVLAATFIIGAPLLWAKPAQPDNAEMLRKLELFATVFSEVRDQYVEEVTDQDLITAAINGALETLDPHSVYIPPAEQKEIVKIQSREYGGLGIEVSMESGLVKVNYVNENAPAHEAGLKKGDLITAVDSKNIQGKTLDEAVEGMRGLAGDPVILTVRSPGQADRDVKLVRQVIQGRAVRHRVEDGLGYIFIETFTHKFLDRDFRRAIADIKSELDGNIPGLIMDLRGNRGGLLDQSVNISGFFLDGGEVLSSRNRKPEETERFHAKPGELLPDVPLVVLINSGSASAAEIVAGAIQDRGRGLIIGRRSFGKGSVQSIIPMDEGSALRMTTHRYYTPSGKSIQGRGILPDVLVASRPDSGKIRKRIRENDLRNSIENEDTNTFEEQYELIDYPPENWEPTEDYQLKKAKELLKSTRYKALIAKYNNQ